MRHEFLSRTLLMVCVACLFDFGFLLSADAMQDPVEIEVTPKVLFELPVTDEEIQADEEEMREWLQQEKEKEAASAMNRSRMLCFSIIFSLGLLIGLAVVHPYLRLYKWWPLQLLLIGVFLFGSTTPVQAEGGSNSVFEYLRQDLRDVGEYNHQYPTWARVRVICGLIGFAIICLVPAYALYKKRIYLRCCAFFFLVTLPSTGYAEDSSTRVDEPALVVAFDPLPKITHIADLHISEIPSVGMAFLASVIIFALLHMPLSVIMFRWSWELQFTDDQEGESSGWAVVICGMASLLSMVPMFVWGVAPRAGPILMVASVVLLFSYLYVYGSVIQYARRMRKHERHRQMQHSFW